MKKRENSHRPQGQNVSQELRHLGVQIETVNDSVKLVAEQYIGIKEEIGGIKKTLDVHTEMIGELTVNMQIVKTDIQTMKRDIEITKTDIEFIKHSFKKKVDVDEFSALERRVILLEKRR